ncbi:MAG: DUF1048 domain-containing protein [Ruminiclostridium sp.]
MKNSDITKIIKTRLELSKKLTVENDRIFTDVICYLKTSSLEQSHAEEYLQDILDMFLNAQYRGEPLSTVIGSDYKQFCDNIIENSPDNRASLLKIINFLESIFLFVNVMFFLEIIFNVVLEALRKKSSIPDYYNVTLGLILKYVIIYAISSVLVSFIGKNSFKFTKKSKRHKFVVGAILWSFIIIPGLLNVTLGNHLLFSTKIYYIVLVILPAFLIIKLIKSRIRV